MLTVKQRGQFVATLRYVQVCLMETLASWVPTTPEMEVKLLFGEHIWDVAQHADALGKRTFELRMPLQHSLRPADSYLEILTELSKIESTPQRLAAIYHVFLPGLNVRYRRYLDETDVLADAPTVRILERHLIDLSRMINAGHSLWQELPALQLKDQNWVDALRKREAAVDRILAPCTATATAEA